MVAVNVKKDGVWQRKEIDRRVRFMLELACEEDPAEPPESVTNLINALKEEKGLVSHLVFDSLDNQESIEACRTMLNIVGVSWVKNVAFSVIKEIEEESCEGA